MTTTEQTVKELRLALARAEQRVADQSRMIARYAEAAPDIDAAVSVLEELNDTGIKTRQMKDTRSIRSLYKLAAELVTEAQELLNVQSAIPVFRGSGLLICVVCQWGTSWSYNREEWERRWRAYASDKYDTTVAVAWIDDEIAAAIKMYW